jgi:hypothetical protein
MSSVEPNRYELRGIEEKKEMKKQVSKKFHFENEASNFRKGSGIVHKLFSRIHLVFDNFRLPIYTS